VSPAGAGGARPPSACTFRDVWERDVTFEDFFGDHDSQAGVKLGGAAGEQGGLAGTWWTGEDDGEAGSNGGSEEAGDGPVLVLWSAAPPADRPIPVALDLTATRMSAIVWMKRVIWKELCR